MKKIAFLLAFILLFMAGCQITNDDAIITTTPAPTVFTLPADKLRSDQLIVEFSPSYIFDSYEDYLNGVDEIKQGYVRNGCSQNFVSFQDVNMFGEFRGAKIYMCWKQVYMFCQGDLNYSLCINSDYFPNRTFVSNLTLETMGSDLRTCDTANGTEVEKPTKHIENILIVDNVIYHYTSGTLYCIYWLIDDQLYTLVGAGGYRDGVLQKLSNYPNDEGSIVIQNLLHKDTAKQQIAELKQLLSQ